MPQVIGSPRDRAEALRRLGGPDVDAERRKNAMSGADKAFVSVVVSAAALIGWGLWLLTQYQTARVLHPPADSSAIVVCMDSCSRQCVGMGQ